MYLLPPFSNNITHHKMTSIYANLHSFRVKHGPTLLHYAAGYGHVAMCRYLLESSTTTNNSSTNDKTNLNLLLSKSNNNERTPLHWAARNGHTSTCQLFIQDYQMPVDTLAKGQVTPLQLSMWQCHLDT